MPRFTYVGRPDLTWPSLLADVPVPGETYDVRHDPNAPDSWQPAAPAGDGLPKKKADLEALAGELGLETTGTAKELRERILARQAEPSAADDASTDDSGAPSDDAGEQTATDANPAPDADGTADDNNETSEV
jgi:hypothetical protein